MMQRPPMRGRWLQLLAWLGVLASGCTSTLDPAAEQACAEGSALYSKLYVNKWGDHTDPAFDQVLAVARQYPSSRGECGTLAGLADLIESARGHRKVTNSPYTTGPKFYFGLLLAIVGVIAALVSGIWLLIVVYQEGIIWLLLYLFVPVAGLVFVFLHWEVAKRPFLLNLAGGVVAAVGAFMMVK